MMITVFSLVTDVERVPASVTSGSAVEALRTLLRSR